MSGHHNSTTATSQTSANPLAFNRQDRDAQLFLETKQWIHEIADRISPNNAAEACSLTQYASLFLEAIAYYKPKLTIKFTTRTLQLYSAAIINSILHLISNPTLRDRCPHLSWLKLAYRGFSKDVVRTVFNEVNALNLVNSLTLVPPYFYLNKFLSELSQTAEVNDVALILMKTFDLEFFSILEDKPRLAAACIAVARYAVTQQKEELWPEDHAQKFNITLGSMKNHYEFMYYVAYLINKNNATKEQQNAQVCDKYGKYFELFTTETDKAFEQISETQISTSITSWEPKDTLYDPHQQSQPPLSTAFLDTPKSDKLQINLLALEDNFKFFENLHVDLYQEIFKQMLNIGCMQKDFLTLRLVCKSFYVAIARASFWAECVPYQAMEFYTNTSKKLNNWPIKTTHCFFQAEKKYPRPIFSTEEGVTKITPAFSFYKNVSFIDFTGITWLEDHHSLDEVYYVYATLPPNIKKIRLPMISNPLKEEHYLDLMESYPELLIDCSGGSLLYWACLLGWEELGLRIIKQIDEKKGAFSTLDPNENRGPGGPLLAATIFYSTSPKITKYPLIEALLDIGADVNQDENNIYPNTPLLQAILKKSTKLVELFVGYGANLTRSKESEGEFPIKDVFVMAKQCGTSKILEFLEASEKKSMQMNP